MKKGTRMISWIRGILLAILLPVVCLVVYINVIAASQMKAQAVQSHTNTLDMWMEALDGRLMNTTNFLQNLLLNSSEISGILQADNETDGYYALIAMKNSISDFALLDTGMNELFFWAPDSPGSHYLSTESGSVGDSWLRSSINMRVKEKIEEIRDEKRFQQWMVEEVEGRHCLIYISKANECYIGAWCIMDSLLDNLVGNMVYEDEQYFLTGPEGELYASFNQAVNSSLNMEREKYVDIISHSAYADFYIVNRLMEKDMISSLTTVRNFMFLLSVLLIAVLPVIMIAVERYIYQPIRRLLASMEKLQDGQFKTAIIQPAKFREFNMMNETFNEMAGKIEDLKIQVYEERLKEQETKLQYLQIQIKPHFLVNVLNLIYSLAEVRDYGGVQQLSIYLVKYFRFMFKKTMSKVLLSDEVAHVKNYMGIQETRFPDSFEYRANYSEAVLGYLIPPLTIQTFIENSIKYAMDFDKRTVIELHIYEERERLHILVKDNGPGFSRQMLEQLEQEELPEGSDETTQIGILNVIKRLQLIYGQSASCSISNEGGACVHISIPAETGQKAED